MSLNRIACPECRAGLKSPSGFAPGQVVSCPKCETEFTVDELSASIAASGEDEAGRERSYKSSWMRYAVLGVLLATLGVLGYMLYEKKMKERESLPDATDKDPPLSTPKISGGAPKLEKKIPSGAPVGGDPDGPGTKKKPPAPAPVP